MDALSHRRLGVVGVPSSAGSHNPGQEKAPAAWRAAGLFDALRATGADVQDFGDVAVRRHCPQDPVDGVRDLDRVVEVACEVKDRVAQVASSGWTPLVLGGDCTITLGVVAGLSSSDGPGLLYFDGDADLNTPETSGSGVLDTMGVSHLLGFGAPELSGIADSGPLLTASRLELFGFDPGELDTHQWATLVGRDLRATPAPAVRENPQAAASTALHRLEHSADRFLLHFDVDALDTGAFPLANFPHFAGLTLDDATVCLTRFCSSPALAGIVITEVNPDHDPDGVLLLRLRDALCSALSSRA